MTVSQMPGPPERGSDSVGVELQGGRPGRMCEAQQAATAGVAKTARRSRKRRGTMSKSTRNPTYGEGSNRSR